MKKLKDLKKQVNEEELKQLKLQDKFYADGYSTWQRIVLFQAVIIAVLFLAFALHMFKNKSKTYFFAASNEEKLIKLAPLSEPFVGKSFLLNFVVEAFNEASTFGFHDYRAKFPDTKMYFTEKGWKNFNKFLEDNKYIELINDERRVVYSNPLFPPLIQKTEIIDGIYKWHIEMPVVMYASNLYNESNRHNVIEKRFLLKLEIIRAYQSDYPKAIAIDSWVEAPIQKK